MMYFLFGYGAYHAAQNAEGMRGLGIAFFIALAGAAALLAVMAFWHWATGPHAPSYTSDPGPR